MIFSVAPLVVLLFASSSILAAPRPSTTSDPSVAPYANLPSLPTRQFLSHPLLLALRSPPPEPPQQIQDQFRTKTAQRNVIIALSTIGGTIVFCFFIAIVRCICRYKRPPKRDRAAEALERHNLQREMDELARNPHALRRPSLREPAPPYIPHPPPYSEASLHREGNHSRNDSTSPPTRNLLPDSPSAPIPNPQ